MYTLSHIQVYSEFNNPLQLQTMNSLLVQKKKKKKKPSTHIVSLKINQNPLKSCIKHYELIDDKKS